MLRSPTVLILLDSAAQRNAIGAHLSSKGYAVVAARTEPEAVAALDRGEVDVAIAGHTPRGASDVVGLLRRASSTGEAPVILITDSAAVRALPQDALPAVVEVFVRGRFSIAELDRAVSRVVRKQ